MIAAQGHVTCLLTLLLVAAAWSAPAGVADSGDDLSSDDSGRTIYAQAVDVNQPISTSAFTCFKQQQGIRTAFVRIFQATGNGYADPNGPATLLNANAAGLGLEVYIEPQPSSTLYGYQQFDAAVTYVTSHGVNLRSVWLMVTSPINWPNNPQANINFINSVMTRAQQRSLGFGIFTNQYDWQQITGGWTGASNKNLWYWHSSGNGASGASAPNFNDFVPFANWNQPIVKQYGKQVLLNQCNSWVVNVDVYAAGSNLNQKKLSEKSDKDDKPTAGLLMENLQ